MEWGLYLTNPPCPCAHVYCCGNRNDIQAWFSLIKNKLFLVKKRFTPETRSINIPFTNIYVCMYFGISVSRDRNIKTYPKNFVDIWFDIGTEHSTTNVLDVSEVLLSCSMRDRLLLLVLLVALMPFTSFC